MVASASSCAEVAGGGVLLAGRARSGEPGCFGPPGRAGPASVVPSAKVVLELAGRLDDVTERLGRLRKAVPPGGVGQLGACTGRRCPGLLGASAVGITSRPPRPPPRRAA